MKPSIFFKDTIMVAEMSLSGKPVMLQIIIFIRTFIQEILSEKNLPKLLHKWLEATKEDILISCEYSFHCWLLYYGYIVKNVFVAIEAHLLLNYS